MNPHGHYEILRAGNVLRVIAIGPFNERAMRDYADSFGQMVDDLSDAPWAVLGIFRGESLFIPEAEERLIDITRWRVQNNMSAVALVLDRTIVTEILRAQVLRIYSGGGANFATFEDEPSALGWLAGQGFDYRPEVAVACS